MTRADAARSFRVLEATWPPAASWRHGAWTIREGKGGGKRVSAATAEAAAALSELTEAERAMAALGQSPLVMVRPGEAALDAGLDAAGYRMVDPVRLYAGEAAGLADPRPRPGRVFAIWPPLAIQRDLWAAGGIDAPRLAVMDRAPAPKTALLARFGDRPAGTAFVAISDGTAMIHAIEVAAEARQQGVGTALIRAAARWARAAGADRLSLAVTRANAPANALYASLGLAVVGKYHYRMK